MQLAGGNGGRCSVCRTANQTQKQYIFQAIMLCASEILLRIYVIINCIKQISILLDTEAAFGFHLGTSDAVTFTPRPYRGSYCPTVITVDSESYRQAVGPITHHVILFNGHTAMLYYIVFRFQGVCLPFLIYSDT